MNNFFGMLARMKYINRWGLMRNTKTENIAEHSLEVAIIAHALAVIGNTYFITYDESVNENIEKSFIELYQSGYKDRLDTIETVKTRYYRNETLMLSIMFTVIFGFICFIPFYWT